MKCDRDCCCLLRDILHYRSDKFAIVGTRSTPANPSRRCKQAQPPKLAVKTHHSSFLAIHSHLLHNLQSTPRGGFANNLKKCFEVISIPVTPFGMGSRPWGNVKLLTETRSCPSNRKRYYLNPPPPNAKIFLNYFRISTAVPFCTNPCNSSTSLFSSETQPKVQFDRSFIILSELAGTP